RQFQLPVNILAHETVRDHDGLALSSRNAYLSEAERSEAPRLYALLQRVQDQLKQGCADREQLVGEALADLSVRGWQVARGSLRRHGDLRIPRAGELRAGEPLVTRAAATLGATRLLDTREMRYGE